MPKASHLTATTLQSNQDSLSVNEPQHKLSQNKILQIICFATFFAAFDYAIFFI